jgi:hypothetical protein
MLYGISVVNYDRKKLYPLFRWMEINPFGNIPVFQKKFKANSATDRRAATHYTTVMLETAVCHLG